MRPLTRLAQGEWRLTRIEAFSDGVVATVVVRGIGPLLRRRSPFGQRTQPHEFPTGDSPAITCSPA